ncbi:MAG TPA: hypothetical protein ENK43_08280 [Planctomycetes bacterium]|nr:hypothetical protein [Planctomycetota bacterium]
MSRAAVFVFLLLTAGCGSRGVPSRTPWVYRLRVPSDPRTLELEAELPAGVSRELSVAAGAEDFVESLVLMMDGDEVLPLKRNEDSWWIPASEDGPFRLRWRFDLAGAAAALRRPRTAQRVGDAFLAPPSTWLVRPLRVRRGIPVILHVESEGDSDFATGIRRGDFDDEYVFDGTEFAGSTYTVLGHFEKHTVRVGGADIDVALLATPVAIDGLELAQWVEEAATMVANYFGGEFPVAHSLVAVTRRGRGAHYATALGRGGAGILWPISRRRRMRDVRKGWVLVHEMVHFIFPQVAERHHWIEEGLASYLEPWVRYQAGVIDLATVFTDLRRGLPMGQPKEGDRGLDHTPTWGRTYWGGALFCFVADLEIRRRTRGRKNLALAVRGIHEKLGGFDVSQPLPRVFAVGDESVGVDVLLPLYEAWKDDAVKVELEAIWRSLGVRHGNSQLIFDPNAPEAWLLDTFRRP